MQDFNPPVSIPEDMGNGVRRVLAPNPSPMTFRGTNTYLLGQKEVAVIDPGPDNPAHLAAIMAAVGQGRVSHILVTHSHMDHSPLASALARATNAQIYAYGPSGTGRSAAMEHLAAAGLESSGEGIDPDFAPDVLLADGARVSSDEWQVEAIWTPGHLGNHLCFAFGDVIFTGDLVMGWASSLVSPPDGDLTDFMASCRRLRTRGAQVFHAGHGAPIADPMGRLDWLIAHREGREQAIVEALRNGPATARTLAGIIYTETPPNLMPAATRNVLAHLIDLYGRKKVTPQGDLTQNTAFMLSG